MVPSTTSCTRGGSCPGKPSHTAQPFPSALGMAGGAEPHSSLLLVRFHELWLNCPLFLSGLWLLLLPTLEGLKIWNSPEKYLTSEGPIYSALGSHSRVSLAPAQGKQGLSAQC